jgi:hypothetical protein
MSFQQKNQRNVFLHFIETAKYIPQAIKSFDLLLLLPIFAGNQDLLFRI